MSHMITLLEAKIHLTIFNVILDFSPKNVKMKLLSKKE